MTTNLGETTHLSTTYQSNGTPFNPTTVTLVTKTPTGISTSVGPGFPIVNNAVGAFYYDYLTTEIGSTEVTWRGVDSTGHVIVVVDVVEVIAVPDMPRFMTSGELDACVGPALVDQLFDDSGAGVRSRTLVSQILRRAEDYMMSNLLGAWGDAGTLTRLAQADAILRWHVAWIALEMASERRPSFLASDGKGQFWSQMQRADAYFDSLYKAKSASVGEATVAANANSGGAVSPVLANPAQRFTFASNKGSPSGYGGF